MIVVNRANQPREFRIAGKWIRWEPSGRPGDSVTFSAVEAASADFEAVKKYFAVRLMPAIKEATDA